MYQYIFNNDLTLVHFFIFLNLFIPDFVLILHFKDMDHLNIKYLMRASWKKKERNTKMSIPTQKYQ